MKSSAEYPPPGYFVRVKNWDECFERSQSRKLKSPLPWVALPTKHDGGKYRKLIRTKQGLTIFGAFCLMIEVAAKMPKRGDLTRHDGSSLTCVDLELVTGANRRCFETAIKVLISPEFGWLELVALSQGAGSGLVEDIPKNLGRAEQSRGEEKLAARARVHDGEGADSPAAAGSRHPYEICLAFAQSRPKIREPARFAHKIQDTGQADDEIDEFLKSTNGVGDWRDLPQFKGCI